MLRIALCDDEANARDGLRLMLERVMDEDTQQVVYEFSSGKNAVSWLKKHPGEIDLLFLDVEMDGMNGMEAAREIRVFNRSLMIVFVTGYAEYVFDGYSVGAMDYLMKPAGAGKLEEVLERAARQLEQEAFRMFVFKNGDGAYRFPLREICYFYSDRRKVTAVTADGEYSFYDKLDQVASQAGGRFIRIHQRYLVNADWVERFSGSEVSVGGDVLPVSRSMKEEAAKKLARAMLGGAK